MMIQELHLRVARVFESLEIVTRHHHLTVTSFCQCIARCALVASAPAAAVLYPESVGAKDFAALM
jgi:hypothetical protein